MKTFEVTELPIDSIIVADRARKELGDLTELKQSIASHGLLQPILVTSEHQLIAGERRLTACRELGQSTIITRVMPNTITAEDTLIIEMMENVARKEFAWHELVELKHKIHKVFQQVEGANWGYRDTAGKLECSLGLLSSDIALAEGIQVFPQLRDMPTKAKARDAYKKLCQRASDIQAMQQMPDEDRQRIEALMNGKVQIDPQAKAQPVPVAQHDDCQTFEALSRDGSQNETPEDDCQLDKPCASYVIKPALELLSELPANSVGLIELDPPYAIGYDEQYAEVNDTKLAEADWTVDQLFSFYQKAFKEFYRILYENAWVLLWTGKEHWQETNKLAAEAGFAVQQPGVWSKKSGASNSPSNLMISTYENFLLLRKGRASFNHSSFPNVVEFTTVPTAQRIHQWEKPIGLYRYLIAQLGRENSVYLSLFTGSGNSLIAAAMEGMKPIGCDTSQKYIHSFYRRFDNYFM